jgi:hypothetical protein
MRKTEQPATSSDPLRASAGPCFEYTGKTALIVIGALSGKRYHFTEPGRRLRVDPRDQPSLAMIRQLSVVKSC